MPRDQERTRERLLTAAREEFAARGLAGARVDAIAERAGVNKRMLYVYFGNKRELFTEVLRHKLAAKAEELANAPIDPSESLLYWARAVAQDREWIRLLQWESLEWGDQPIPAEHERRKHEEAGIAGLRIAQEHGMVAADLDPRQLMLACVALVTFPAAFPRPTHLITGGVLGDAGFESAQAAFLQRLADLLRPRAEPHESSLDPERTGP